MCGQAGGAGNLASEPQDRNLPSGISKAAAPLTNGPQLPLLICGVALNNKMLLKSGTWHE